MDIVDRIFPPDPANADALARYDADIFHPIRASLHFARDALRESEILERAKMHQQIYGDEPLYDPVTGMHLELVERNGLLVYVSPDNPDFGYEPQEPAE